MFQASCRGSLEPNCSKTVCAVSNISKKQSMVEARFYYSIFPYKYFFAGLHSYGERSQQRPSQGDLWSALMDQDTEHVTAGPDPQEDVPQELAFHGG